MPDTTMVDNPIDTSETDQPYDCAYLEDGELQFTFKDSLYTTNQIIVETFIDTFSGAAFQLFTDSLFFRKFILIEAILNDSQTMKITFVDVELPLMDCLPTGMYYDFNDDGAEMHYCFFPNPDFQQDVCTSYSANVRTVYSAVSIGISLPSYGSLNLIHCENGYISGEFENEFFQNGSFCKLLIN